MIREDSRHSEQSKSGSRDIPILGREKRVEDLVDDLEGNAGPGVCDLDEQMIAIVRARRNWFARYVFRFNGQDSVGRHGVTSVHANINEYLLQMRRVADNGPEVVGERSLDLD